jgi:chromosome partitioning protein
MQVIVLASQKGGAGKTTLTGHLAIAAEQRGVRPVIMINTDPQGSLSTWWNRREAKKTPLLSPLPHLRDLPGRLDELQQGGVSLAIIDTPPAITSSIREVMRVANLVVMPVRPSPHDLDAIGATIDLAQAAGVPFVFAVTQAKMQARVTPQTVALLSAHGTVAPSIIQDRVIYATAMTDGRTAGDIEPKGAAALEILELWDFVQGRLDDRKKGAKEGRKKVA